MIKEFAEWFISRTATETKEVGGQIFSTEKLHHVPQSTPASLTVRNLTGLVDYLTSNYDNQPPVLVQVASPTEVNVYSTFNRDMARNHLLQAKAMLPEIPFKNFMDAESFNILLQSCFVQNDHRALLLSIVGNITDENVVTVGDNGIAQQVTAKTGIAQVGNVMVPNPVFLKPFRTFVEIEQPESQFVFRMQRGPKAALFEADGGAWKLQAIHSIRDYLNTNLADQIKNNKVTIIA